MANKKEVIKHSAAIQISNEVSLLERRTWNVLLANAYDELPMEETYEIPISELAQFLDYDSRNTSHLKQSLKKLRSTEVEWNILNKDQKEEWGVSGLLAEVKIVNGMCCYSYGPTLRKNLYNPHVYAKISLFLQNQFRSKHTLAIYELVVDYHRIGETPFIEIENFRKLLGMKDDEYKEFKSLNRDVIKKAIEEISEKSDLSVTVEYQKRKRKTVALKFRIKKKTSKDTIIDIDDIEKTLSEKPSLLPLLKAEIDNQELLDTLVDEFGISKGKAVKILKTKDEFFIEEVLDTVRDRINEGKVNNVPAFTVKAIEDDYRAKKSKYDAQKDKSKRRKEKKENHSEILRQLQEEFHFFFRERVDEAYNALAEEEKQKLREDFKKDEIEKANDFIKNGFAIKGMNFSAIKPIFRTYIADQLLPEEDRDFKQWAKKKGHDVRWNGEEYEFM